MAKTPLQQFLEKHPNVRTVDTPASDAGAPAKSVAVPGVSADALNEWGKRDTPEGMSETLDKMNVQIDAITDEIQELIKSKILTATGHNIAVREAYVSADQPAGGSQRSWRREGSDTSESTTDANAGIHDADIVQLEFPGESADAPNKYGPKAASFPRDPDADGDGVIQG